MLRVIRTSLWIGATLFVAFAASWVFYMPDRHERGFWQARAGGLILSVGPLQTQAYAATSHSCGPLYRFSSHLKLIELTQGTRIAVADDVLTLSRDGALDPLLFDRIAEIPESCDVDAPDTPRAVFDAIWTAMNEHYAFFDLYDVDWAARAALAPAHDTEMDDAALLALLEKALAGLNDGHIQIATPFRIYTPKQPPAWLTPASGLNRQTLRRIARDALGVPVDRIDGSAIDVALLPDQIVYLIINEMTVGKALGQSGFEAGAAVMTQIAPLLSDAAGLIIDVRYNPGGSDDVALGVASHFAGLARPIFTTTTRVGDGQTAPFTVNLPAHDDSPITTPVVLLTSELTASAAEIFTLAMRTLPQVTVMGERTGGGLSDVAGFVLPNGWRLRLSNQTYRTMDGALYEGIGIPPNIALPFVAADFAAGRDPILAAALAHVRGE